MSFSGPRYSQLSTKHRASEQSAKSNRPAGVSVNHRSAFGSNYGCIVTWGSFIQISFAQHTTACWAGKAGTHKIHLRRIFFHSPIASRKSQRWLVRFQSLNERAVSRGVFSVSWWTPASYPCPHTGKGDSTREFCYVQLENFGRIQISLEKSPVPR